MNYNRLRHCSEHNLALVAVGNSLRGDDGIAAAVCECLPSDLLDRVCYFHAELDVFAIPAFAANHAGLVLVDAVHGDLPGSKQWIKFSPADAKTSVVSATHGLSWLDEISLALQTHSLPKEICFFGITVRDVGWSSRLSPGMAGWLADLSASLSQRIAEELEDLQCMKRR